MTAKNKSLIVGEPLLLFLSHYLTDRDKIYFSEGSSELHPPNNCTADDLWWPLKSGHFPDFFDLQTLENIYHLLEDDGFDKKYRNLYITSIYIFASQNNESNYHYFSNFILNTLASLNHDLEAIDHFHTFIKKIDETEKVLAPEEKYYIKMTLFVLSRLKHVDNQNMLGEVKSLYQLAFDYVANESPAEFWEIFNTKDYEYLKQYFLGNSSF